MILNTGTRTDIPAFYSEWFYNRIHDGYVMVRNPYNPSRITKYRLDPEVIDAMVFCTKNPKPMLKEIDLLSDFSMFWFVTITPYGKDIEPNVPDKKDAIKSFIKLSEKIGPGRISWRYDPVFITEKYSANFHIEKFEEMAEALSGYTNQCVISFLDLYEKTKRNFPEAKTVSRREQEELVRTFSSIAVKNSLQIHLCCESSDLVCQNIDADGCMSKKVLEDATGYKLVVPKKKYARQECSCLLGSDIGAYNTCAHGCKYCYANYDQKTVRSNIKQHDSHSPLLIGWPTAADTISDAKQTSWRDCQMSLSDFF